MATFITWKSLLFIVLIFLNLICSISSISLLKNDKSGSSRTTQEPIDPSGKYFLSWEVDELKEEITFQVEVESKGYIGFGISPSGSMVGADIFIAGVRDDGSSYSGDYHGGVANGMPTIDVQDDWTLIDAKENSTHTILKFSRLLNTCDEQDYEITPGTNQIIWSIGSSDQISYHGTSRGSFTVSLLSPVPPFDTEDEEIKYFDTDVEMEMPSLDTTYWCTIHAGPILNEKHQIIAFEANLPTIEAQNYTHHFVFYNCYAPEGENADDFFGKYLNGTGNHCNLPSNEQTVPIANCEEYLFAWAKGGKKLDSRVWISDSGMHLVRMVFPDNVGFPIGERPGQKQYYMLEIHYDNPEKVAGLKFKTGLRSYYTAKSREHDAILLAVGHMVNPSLTIPPDTNSFVVAGHCPSQCTDEFIPQEGVTVFNALLHSHISGRKLKIRHFRNGVELPWLAYDDHYDFNYQQNKPVTDVVKIMPGDQITYECTYDSTWNKDHEIIIGGFPSRQEMCQAYIWTYPRQALDYCASLYPYDKGLKSFGITNYTIVNVDAQDELYINEPMRLKGSYVDSISHKFNWTAEFRKNFQENPRYGQHDFECFSRKNVASTIMKGKVEYSKVLEEYVPENKCLGTSAPPTGSNTVSTTVSVPDPTTVSVPDPTTVSVPDPTTVSVPDSTTASVPDSTTVSVPDFTTASTTNSITDTTSESSSGVVNYICLSAKFFATFAILLVT